MNSKPGFESSTANQLGIIHTITQSSESAAQA